MRPILMEKTQCRRILVVEDDEQIGDFVRQGLTEAGFSVDVAADGLQGFELAASGDHKILIIDIMLPGMDGLEILRRLRAMEFNTPVLILSAKRSVNDRVTGLQIGADG